MRSIKLCHVTTIPFTQLQFFRGQNLFMQSQGFDVHSISSPEPELLKLAERDSVTVHAISISRKLKPINDFMALIKMYTLFIRLKPQIVQYGTPKAALITALASFAAGVPVRIYLVRGSVFINSEGISQMLYRLVEKIIILLSTKTVFNSYSMMNFFLKQGIGTHAQACVIHNGMSNGIDSSYFDPNQEVLLKQAKCLKKRLNFPDGGVGWYVIGYVGRLAADKGINDLYKAWTIIREKESKTILLLVGPIDDRDPIPQDIIETFQIDPRVCMKYSANDTSPYYSLMDVLAFPSYREGFPNVPMEAASMQVPAVTTKVIGCVDAVVDGITGILVPPKDPEALAEAIIKLIRDPELRAKMGKAGRERVIRDFRPEDIWEALYEEYCDLLMEKGLPIPVPVRSL